jgi:hypothetical protein
MRGVIVVGVALLALTGCKSTEQRVAEDDGFCRSIGASPGSNAYIQCRLVQQQRQDVDRARRRRIFNEGLDDMQRSASGNRNLNCTSRRGPFDTVETNCN